VHLANLEAEDEAAGGGGALTPRKRQLLATVLVGRITRVVSYVPYTARRQRINRATAICAARILLSAISKSVTGSVLALLYPRGPV